MANLVDLKLTLLQTCKTNDTRAFEKIAASQSIPLEILNSCLQCACAYGATETAEMLIALGATINERTVSGDFNFSQQRSASFKHMSSSLAQENKIRYALPALHLAIQAGHYRTTDMLLSHGGDINFRSSEGLTPMHLACMSGDIKALEYLIRNKASVTLHDSKGSTPLLTAVSSGHLDVVVFLLNNHCYMGTAGLSQQKRVQLMKAKNNISSMSILHTVCTESQIEILKYLGTKKKFIQIVMQLMIDEKDNNNKTALHHAVEQKNIPLIEELIRCFDPNPNVQDQDGNTPYHYAVASKNQEIIALISQAGGKPDIKNRKGFSGRDMAKKYSLPLPR